MSKKKVLVIAAHPDDEVLGCGATIAKHAKMGDEVHVVILAEGLTSREIQRNRANFEIELSELARTAQEANKLLGANSVSLHDLPDNRMDSLDLLDVVKVIERIIEEHQPEIIYTHHIGDVNIDHQIIHKAVVTACRPVPGHSVKTLLFFEVPSSTEWQMGNSAPNFLPNWFVDVTDTLELKIRALGVYKSEMRSWPHPRSVQAVEYLARWRGSSVGIESAEAFMVGRNLLLR